MSTKSCKLLLLTALLFFTVSDVFSQSSLPDGVTLRVVIIRHGEKPPKGDNLSCQGFNRAIGLPAVLYSKFGKPDYTYVPRMKTGKSTSSVRMFQTVSPFAIKYNLTVDTRYAETDSVGVAGSVVKKTGTVLLVWEHGNIPPIARALGVQNVPGWKGSDFDSIWIIDFPAGGGTPVMTIGSEGLKPGTNCPN